MQPVVERQDAHLERGHSLPEIPAPGPPSSANLSLLVVGTSFRNSPISFRESLFRHLSDPQVRERLHKLPHVAESVLLTTCNRIEAYFATSNARSTGEAFFNNVAQLTTFPPDYFYKNEGIDTITHLFSVSAGLDSMVLGEDQIIEQVRDTGISERVAGHSKAVLSALFDASCSAARRIRSQSKGAADSSVSEFALKFALRKLGHRPKSTILIGTGKMVRLAAQKMQGSRVHVVTSRDAPPSALKNANLVRRDQMRKFADRSELIIAATRHSGYLLGKDDLSDGRRRVVLDLAFPRNVDPTVKELRSTSLYDLDALAKEAAKSSASVQRATADARRQVAKEAATFHRWLLASKLSDNLPALYRWGERVRGEELRAAFHRLSGLSEREKQVVEVMSRRLVSKILSRPTRFVKNPDVSIPQKEKLRLVEKVFMLEGQDEV